MYQYRGTGEMHSRNKNRLFGARIETYGGKNAGCRLGAIFIIIGIIFPGFQKKIDNLI
jgi:hypothetical protein